MLSLQFKKTLLIVLIGLAVILFAANLLFKTELIPIDKQEDLIDEQELNQRFENILFEFGIEEQLIKKTTTVDKHSGEEISNFKVQVPIDLSIPQILQSAFQVFRKDSLIILSEEKIKGGRSIFTIKSGSAVLLQAEFNYAKNYSRNKGYISFILKDVDPANQTTIELIESTDKLNFLIRPEIKHLQQLESFRNNGQQFSVLIDDDISEQKYRLSAAFSEQRIITVIKTLVTDYRNAVCFIVDDKSNFSSSKNFEIFERELSKRKIKFFHESDFINLPSDKAYKEKFNEKLESLAKGGSVIFLASEKVYLDLSRELEIYKKQGYRVIFSSLIL